MFSIGEFSRIARVSRRLLQFYDEEGLLKPAHTNRQNGYRKYRAEQLRDLNRILALQELGLTLEEIRRNSRESGDEQLLKRLRQRQVEIQAEMRADLRRLRSIEARLTERNLPDVVVKPIEAVAVLTRKVLLEVNRNAWPWILETETLMRQAVGARLSPGMILTMPGAGFETESFWLEASMRTPDGWNPATLGETDVLHYSVLPPIAMAATAVQTGGPDLLPIGCMAIGHWIERQGYELCGTPRELLLHSCLGRTCEEMVMEAQFPIVDGGSRRSQGQSG